MGDNERDQLTFAVVRARLDEILAQVRKKDLSLEASLDLLDEGVLLANQCTELIDRADWDASPDHGPAAASDDSPRTSDEGEED